MVRVPYSGLYFLPALVSIASSWVMPKVRPVEMHRRDVEGHWIAQKPLIQAEIDGQGLNPKRPEIFIVLSFRYRDPGHKLRKSEVHIPLGQRLDPSTTSNLALASGKLV